jgi:hypothetical protein
VLFGACCAISSASNVEMATLESYFVRSCEAVPVTTTSCIENNSSSESVGVAAPGGAAGGSAANTAEDADKARTDKDEVTRCMLVPPQEVFESRDDAARAESFPKIDSLS